MPAKAKWVIVVLILFILITQLYILYFIKYSNQNLSLHNFNLYIPGNLINFIFSLVLISGVIIYSIKNQKDNNYKALITYTFITSLLLLTCFLTLYVEIPQSKIYIFEQTLSKSIVGFLFALFQFVQFMFIVYVWLRIFTEKNLIFLRVLFNSVIIVLLLLLLAYFYIEIEMKNYSEKLDAGSGDNIAVVLGAAVWSGNQPSPTLASRIDKAAKLYNKGIVNKILLTGSNAPGELTEAEVAFNYIINKDVDTTDIMLENQTTSTTGQIRFIKNNLSISGRYAQIFIISDQYHLVRIREISRFYNLRVIVAASELQLSFEAKLYNKIRECIALSIFWCFSL
ncbi:MAG: YdcF family protein [Ignavibacteriales bacterium]|nr:MAG: YdcF family protein [Ignavibacteriales bacterium]